MLAFPAPRSGQRLEGTDCPVKESSRGFRVTEALLMTTWGLSMGESLEEAINDPQSKDSTCRKSSGQWSFLSDVGKGRAGRFCSTSVLSLSGEDRGVGVEGWGWVGQPAQGSCSLKSLIRTRGKQFARPSCVAAAACGLLHIKFIILTGQCL